MQAMATELHERFERAATREPLSALDPAAARELRGLLGEARDFEELPGKWQAALLRAEGAGGEKPAGGCCSCGG